MYYCKPGAKGFILSAVVTCLRDPPTSKSYEVTITPWVYPLFPGPKDPLARTRIPSAMPSMRTHAHCPRVRFDVPTSPTQSETSHSPTLARSRRFCLHMPLATQHAASAAAAACCQCKRQNLRDDLIVFLCDRDQYAQSKLTQAPLRWLRPSS